MPYCCRADIEARLPELPEVGINDKTDSQVESGIEDAQTEIDGQLGGLYTVPFDLVPNIIKGIAAYFAAAFILDSGFSGGAEGTKLANHYRAIAQGRLDRILNGTLLLYPADTEAEDGGDFYADHSGQEPTLAEHNPYDVRGSIWPG